MSMGTSLRSYYRGHSLVSMRDGQANASRYYHFDAQGTTQCLTDASGAVTDRFAADAWGVEVKRTGNSINRHWYIGNSGYYATADTPKCYVRRRTYVQADGRFLSRDPVRQRPRSAYLYVRGTPTIATDPSGRITITPVLADEWLFPKDQGSKAVCCGFRCAFWLFELTKPAPKEGFMVQKVSIDALETDCVTGVEKEFKDVYWEAWSVYEGDTQWRRNDNKTFQYTEMSVFTGSPGTRGRHTNVGEVRFFTMDVTGDLDIRWDPIGVGLPATRTEPVWWPSKSIEGPATRSASSNWDCCPPECPNPDQRYTTSVATPLPGSWRRTCSEDTKCKGR